jgi:hypothetical protein
MPEKVVRDLRSRLEQCVEEEPTGRLRFAVTLPNREALDAMAQTLAGFLVAGEPAGQQVSEIGA